MKKLIISLLAVTLFFTACSGQKSYTVDQVKEIVEPYMYKLSIGLSTEWCGDEDDVLLETVGGNIFKALLESVYRTDNGREIYNEGYMVKIEDYVDVATEYFPYDKEFITEHFKGDRTYNAETDMIACSDGLGSVVSMEISSVEQNGDVYKVNYDAYGPDNAFFEDYGYLTVKINKKGKPVFLSNTVNENIAEQLQDTEFKLKDNYSVEALTYSANAVAERLVSSMSTKSVPENPEFNKIYFLFAMASWKYQNENFIYNNAFPYEENGYDTVFSFDTCEKVIYQVYGDSSWQAKDNFSEDSIQGDKAVQSTDIGWGVLFYGLKEDRQVIFSDDGTQVTVRAEMVGPGDTTLDPEIISWGIYDVVLDIVKENGEQFLRFNRFALVENEQNSTDNSNTDNIKQLEADILLAVENIGQAHSFYYGKFISGDMVDGEKILPEDKSPYPDSNYYAHLPEYDTVEELKALACRYFSEEVFENSFMSEFEPKHEGILPYLVEVDGTIYNNLSYGTGGKAIFMPETAKVTAVNGNNATVTLQYYNAMDEALKETTTVDMVYENGKWVFNQAFLLKQYE